MITFAATFLISCWTSCGVGVASSLGTFGEISGDSTPNGVVSAPFSTTVALVPCDVAKALSGVAKSPATVPTEAEAGTGLSAPVVTRPVLFLLGSDCSNGFDSARFRAATIGSTPVKPMGKWLELQRAARQHTMPNHPCER